MKSNIFVWKSCSIRFCVIFVLFCFLCICSIPGQDEESNRRIVSLSPNITEILDTLGLDSQIVGITEHCHIESLKKTKTSIGTFYSPNYELIMTLNPGLIIGLESQKVSLDKLHTLLPKSTIVTVRNEPIAMMLESIKTIGRATGTATRANDLVTSLTSAIEGYRTKSRGFKIKPRVLCVVDHSPNSLQQIYAVGRSTYMNELLDIVGAENVVSVSTPQYPIISRESIISFNPDIILDTAVGDDATTESLLRIRNIWNDLPRVDAVKNNRVFVIKEKFLTIPAPRSIQQSLALLYDLIYPNT